MDPVFFTVISMWLTGRETGFTVTVVLEPLQATRDSGSSESPDEPARSVFLPPSLPPLPPPLPSWAGLPVPVPSAAGSVGEFLDPSAVAAESVD